MDNYTSFIKTLADLNTKRFTYQCNDQVYGINNSNSLVKASVVIEILGNGSYKIFYLERNESGDYQAELELYGFFELKNEKILLKTDYKNSAISNTELIGECVFSNNADSMNLNLLIRSYLLKEIKTLKLIKTANDFTIIKGDKIFIPKFLQLGEKNVQTN